MNIQRCPKCGGNFVPEPIDDEDDAPMSKVCYHCFEDSIEEFEEKRRERIAIANEY